jgi:ribosomal protein L18
MFEAAYASASHVIQSNTPHVFIGAGGIAGGGRVKGIAKGASKGVISIENVIFLPSKS